MVCHWYLNKAIKKKRTLPRLLPEAPRVLPGGGGSEERGGGQEEVWEGGRRGGRGIRYWLAEGMLWGVTGSIIPVKNSEEPTKVYIRERVSLKHVTNSKAVKPFCNRSQAKDCLSTFLPVPSLNPEGVGNSNLQMDGGRWATEREANPIAFCLELFLDGGGNSVSFKSRLKCCLMYLPSRHFKLWNWHCIFNSSNCSYYYQRVRRQLWTWVFI